MKKSISKTIAGIAICAVTACYTGPVLAYTKDETVYSKLNLEGNQYKTIVSTHIKNEENEEILKDISNLLNIENTNGDERFEKDGDNLTWKSDGKDIYYQGETQKELPIECTIKYELNGEEIQAKDIVGKEGNVKITLTYTNKDEHTVNINGKNTKLYTPFVVVAGTIIDTENNKNINITNGKVIDNGNKVIAMGMAFPGLQESLNISKEKIEIPNQVKISMDSKDFEMGSIMNFVTPKVIEDISMLDDIEEIYSKVNTLESSSKQIEEGANTLKQGTSTYSQKMQEFESAMTQLSNGMTNANNSYNKINEGIGTLSKSSKQLSNGIDTIVSKVDQIEVPDNSAKITELEKLITVNTNSINLLNATNEGLKAQITPELSEEAIKTLKTQIQGNETLVKVLGANIQAQKETIATLQSIDTSSINELKIGLQQLQNGLKLLNNGTQTLESGSKEMKKGLNTLDASSNQILKANHQLTEGAKTIDDGATKLEQGISKFNKEGIQKICDYINKDVKDVTNRVEKLSELSKDYNNFTMLEDGANGEVKFIMIIDAIEKQEDTKQDAIINEEKIKEEEN